MTPPDAADDDDPRAQLNATVWEILQNAYIRATFDGEPPPRVSDRLRGIERHKIALETDYRAILSCMEQAAIIDYGRIVRSMPERPERQE